MFNTFLCSPSLNTRFNSLNLAFLFPPLSCQKIICENGLCSRSAHAAVIRNSERESLSSRTMPVRALHSTKSSLRGFEFPEQYLCMCVRFSDKQVVRFIQSVDLDCRHLLHSLRCYQCKQKTEWKKHICFPSWTMFTESNDCDIFYYYLLSCWSCLFFFFTFLPFYFPKSTKWKIISRGRRQK